MQCDAFHASQIQSAATRLILALALSLALHLALAFLVQVKPADRFDTRSRVLQVHLPKRLAADSRQAGETPSPATAPISIQPPAPKLARKTSTPPSQPAAAPPAPVPTAPAAAPLPAVDAQPKEEAANYAAPPPAPVQAMRLPQSPLPTVDIPLIEDPTYYTAKQVDIHPMAVEPIKPEYPEAAATAGIEGFVTLRLLIDATGVVREISVVEAQPPDTFETAALNAFRNARFIAAQRNDRPVKSDVRIKVMFEIIEATGARGAE